MPRGEGEGRGEREGEGGGGRERALGALGPSLPCCLGLGQESGKEKGQLLLL
jgi:hypothetical protein